MLMLGLDTSTDVASVAIGDGSEIIAAATLPSPGAHSEAMLPAVRDLLTETQIGVERLEAVTVGSGPGSFTGLRIGAALAKGLCFARRLPLYAYSSLSAIMAGTPLHGRACSMSDARGGRVYAATFRSTMPLRELSPPRVWRVSELLADLMPLEGWTFGGDGAIRHRDRIEEAGGRLLPDEISRPRAEALLLLARERPEGRVENVLGWQPEYLLPSAAERMADRGAAGGATEASR